MIIRGKLPNHQLTDVTVEGDKIVAVEPASPSTAYDRGGDDLYLGPGFIDLQLNGYDGVDFNDPATTTEQVLHVVRQVRRTGVTSFCPTIITGSAAHTEQCIANIVRAIEAHDEVARAVIGLHIEGPYISPEDGPRGAHPREHVRPPDWNEFRRWQDLAKENIRIVTLSPEWPGAIEFIERAKRSGVAPAIGHTAATPQQIRDAVNAGAKLSTHLGNGSHAKIDRHPNYIWEQLAEDKLFASMIVDGHHLPPSVVKCFVRCKTVSRAVLVTDAIAAAGRPAGRYKLGPVEVEVTPERRVNLPGTPYLAGSVLEMHEAVGNMVAYAGVSLEDAVKMASHNASRVVGLCQQRGSVMVGKRADLILFTWDAEAKRLEVVSDAREARNA